MDLSVVAFRDPWLLNDVIRRGTVHMETQKGSEDDREFVFREPTINGLLVLHETLNLLSTNN